MSAVSEQALRNTLPDRVKVILYAMGFTHTGDPADFERARKIIALWNLSAADYSRAIKVALEYIGQ